MVVPPPKPSLFQLTFLTGDKPLLTLDDDEFLRNHTKVLLISEASDKIWEVKLDGNRLAGGWEEFAAVSNFSHGDVLVFRHNGEEIFHVAVSSESDDDESDDTDDSESDESNDTDDSESDESNDTDDSESDDSEDNDEGDSSLVNKSEKPEADTSSDCFLRARVTPYSLTKDRLDLSRDFKFMSFDENKKPFEIYLANEKGRKWTLRLSRNISSGAFYITRGWSNFCAANGLIRGDFCYFKLSESGERPVLLLCSHESGNVHEDKEEEEECPEADAVKICSVGGCSNEKSTPSRFLTRKFTPSRFKTGQLYISMFSSGVLRESGIKKSGEMTLLDNDGRKWPSYLHKTGQPGGEWCYIREGWREMCEANGVEVNDSFVLELIFEDANPIFKLHSKIKNKGKGNIVTSKKRALHARTAEKTPGVEIDGERGSKRGRTRGSQPESCSVSDQVANVRQSIQDTLDTIRHFRAELETREKNLEASLLEVDDLGMFLNLLAFLDIIIIFWYLLMFI
ncbi:B3 domain-containing protein REM1 isoform X2 [Brassica rapa]|uniref:B3 domain-containing protein REM1 isoform X2 n=1 Tax=Brassica campestris TaxID=3711 RepID=UPI00142D9741|nr:B3 domain-containing protein REM1 isoform X2 [Brassica rapa]